MRFNQLWLVMTLAKYVASYYVNKYCRYDVFLVSTPLLWYNITVRLFQLEVAGGGDNSSDSSKVDLQWRQVSTIPLSPATPLGRSDDGRVSC